MRTAKVDMLGTGKLYLKQHRFKKPFPEGDEEKGRICFLFFCFVKIPYIIWGSTCPVRSVPFSASSQ